MLVNEKFMVKKYSVYIKNKNLPQNLKYSTYLYNLDMSFETQSVNTLME